MIRRTKQIKVAAALVIIYFFLQLNSHTDVFQRKINEQDIKNVKENNIGFKQYVDRSKFYALQKPRGKINRMKYIQYECNVPHKVCGGWADRLKGIMSTYALSMILNRSFLLQITQPCYIETLLQPNQINWNTKIDRKNIKTHRIDDNYILRELFEHVDLNWYS